MSYVDGNFTCHYLRNNACAEALASFQVPKPWNLSREDPRVKTEKKKKKKKNNKKNPKKHWQIW